jgi:hypothetical protein
MTRAEHTTHLQVALRRERVAFPLYALLLLVARYESDLNPPSLIDLASEHGTTYLGVRYHMERNSDLFHIIQSTPRTCARLSEEGIKLVARINSLVDRHALHA